MLSLHTVQTVGLATLGLVTANMHPASTGCTRQEVRKEIHMASRLFGCPLTSGARSERIVVIDAEDPDRSSWCRYINEARGSEEW